MMSAIGRTTQSVIREQAPRMREPEIPEDEPQRLAKLDSLGIVYTPAEERFDRITKLARSVFDVPIALVSLVTQKCQWFKSAQGLTASETSREISFCGHAILQQETFVVSDTLQHPDFVDNPLVTSDPFIRFYAGHPLMYEGSAMGTLCLIDRRPRELSEEDLEMLRGMAAWAENEMAMTVLNATQRQLSSELDDVRRQAMLDPLTKVWNRQGMDQVVGVTLEQALRAEHRVVLMLLDIDHYKEVNDNYGHVAGDVALKEVAQRIRASVRPNDVVVRYGGDEFLVLAADCPDDMALMLAQRILRRVNESSVMVDGEEMCLSLSIGVTSIAASALIDITQMIKSADAALYEAKSAGRNTVKVTSLS